MKRTICHPRVPVRSFKDAKLAKDFQAVLVEFQGAQKLALQSREKSFTTSMVQSFPLPPPTIANRLEEEGRGSGIAAANTPGIITGRE
jgi:hypothetical protein